MLLETPTRTPAIQLADWTQTMSRSVLRQMIAVISRPGILSFAGGLPAPELFPVTDYARAIAHVLATDAKALQYGPPYQPLKTHIVQLMAQRGVTCNAEQVFLTTGAQQGLDVLIRLLVNPGAEVILEEIVYTGVQQALAPYQPRILTVATDLDLGIEVDEIAAHLANGVKPALIYLVPDAHNPLGVSISRTRRHQLIDLALRYNIPLIEDDPYGFLQYEHTPEAPMRALNDTHVFYLGSFSKLLAPALRLGWMIAPEAMIPKLTVAKEASDLESSALTQRAVAAYLDAGHFPTHIDLLRTEYGRRRDAMLQALERYFPAAARWTEPVGGMFIWVELPVGIDTTELLATAVAQAQVAFIPGSAFAVPGHNVTNCLRLNFSNAPVDQIEAGIQRLAAVIKQGDK